jgi:hypothetical protein
LISGLIGDSGGPSGVATPGTVATYVPHPKAYRTRSIPSRPSISRQIQYEPEEEMSERISLGHTFRYTLLEAGTIVNYIIIRCCHDSYLIIVNGDTKHHICCLSST